MLHTPTLSGAGGTGCRIGRVRPAPALLALAVLSLSACASLPAAQVALPAPLASQTPELVEGIGLGRSGGFTLGGASGTFDRGRDRLELFEIVNRDSASTRYALTLADGARTEAACKGTAVEVTWRVLAGDARPFSFECEWRGARSAQLAVNAPALAVGMKAERTGRFTMNGASIAVQSLHGVQGSPLPLEAPIGYLFSQGGRPVGAIELNGPTPRLWRPAAGEALHEPVTLAALALALLWDPARTSWPVRSVRKRAHAACTCARSWRGSRRWRTCWMRTAGSTCSSTTRASPGWSKAGATIRSTPRSPTGMRCTGPSSTAPSSVASKRCAPCAAPRGIGGSIVSISSLRHGG